MTEQPGGDAIDAVTFEVASSALISITEEMGSVLKRSSYSPIIRDMDDFSCAVFDKDGFLTAQADYIPAQLGAMSLVVRAIIERWQGRVQDGDVYISNHPFLGAMHLPDINIVSPVFVAGQLVAWAGTAAHHIDVGGVNPGSEGPDLQDIYAEGLLLPPCRLYIAGQENADLFEVVTENIRDPLSTISDLRAQRAACALAERRIRELADQYGLTTLLGVFDRMLTLTEHGVRLSLSDLEDGTGQAEGFLDDDGRGGRPTRIHVRVDKRADALRVDLSGSDDQVAGAMNVPWASVRACVVYAVRAVVAPDLMSNDGLLRPVTIICPPGNVLNPLPPAAVSVRHNTCQRLADTLVRAFADMWPHTAVASSTVSFFCVNIGSFSPQTGRPSVLADVVGGGTGATVHGDGLDGVDTYMSNVGVMPAEVAETNYQVRVLRSEFVEGSGGQGEHRGGLGIRREYQILDRPQRVTFYAEQTRADFAPSGVAGGGAAAPTVITVLDPDGNALEVASKATLTLDVGSVLRVETAGGGGYGSIPGLNSTPPVDPTGSRTPRRRRSDVP